jgi:hypothetical protein
MTDQARSSRVAPPSAERSPGDEHRQRLLRALRWCTAERGAVRLVMSWEHATLTTLALSTHRGMVPVPQAAAHLTTK